MLHCSYFLSNHFEIDVVPEAYFKSLAEIITNFHIVVDLLMAPKGPYKLCSVNKVPERAKRLIGRLVEDVKEEYTILYLANSESTRSLSKVFVLATRE